MSMLSSFNGRMVMLVALLGLFATAMYGFAAGNTVDATQAGQGKGEISGYLVNDIEYTFNADNAITAVQFTLNPTTATEARARLLDTNGDPLAAWDDCSVAAGVWTCNPPTPVSSQLAEDLEVFATNNNTATV